MSIICPSVLANSAAEFDTQIQTIAPFASRIQIDMMDKAFTGVCNSISLDDVWWPHHITADIHLMYQNPFEVLETLVHMQPNMVIVHVETMIHHMHFAAELHKEGIKAGLAILPETPVRNVEQILHSFDHLLIFSGHLGHFGGQADLGMLSKIREGKAINDGIEIGWDGGINADNAGQIISEGVDVLNVGGYIQKAVNPHYNYKLLVSALN